MSPTSVEDFLWKIGVGLTLVLCARLWRLGLLREYRLLVIFVAFIAVRDVALMCMPPRSTMYAWVYFCSTPITWILAVFVALDVYGRVLLGYRRLSVLTRRTLIVTLSLSTLGALGFVLFSIWGKHDPYPILRFVLAFEQAIALTLLLFLLVLTAFLLWYPVPLKRNLIVYSLGYSVFLFTYIVTVAMRNMAGHWFTGVASTILVGIYAACLLLWTIRINVAGESEMRSAAIPRGEDQERRLLEQLSAMNALLEGGRKG